MTTAFSKYRDWLAAEVKQAPDSCVPGLYLALSALDLIAPRLSVKTDYCGVYTYEGNSAYTCWQEPSHQGPHDAAPQFGAREGA